VVVGVRVEEGGRWRRIEGDMSIVLDVSLFFFSTLLKSFHPTPINNDVRIYALFSIFFLSLVVRGIKNQY